MSGIIAVFRRDRSPVSAAELRQPMAALAHRGPDGFRIRRSPFAALGLWHHWTTPEEVGERQPLRAANGCQLVFDGRLDNRGELLRKLGQPPAVAPSDAALLLRAYERWGTDCFRRLVGPFATAIFDPWRHQLICARDPLGSRTLFYHCTPRRLVVASEEQAVIAHPEIDGEPDRRRLAEHLALRVPADGRTFWRGVRELAPAHLLIVGEDSQRQQRFWQPRPAVGLDRLTDGECAERFAELLEQSVRSRLRAAGAPAVLMSGGLDSTSVAAVAARRLAADGAAPLTTISWVFDELESCDERRFILPVCRMTGARPVLLGGDGAWPLRQPQAWGLNSGTPEENPYRLLKTAAYRAASERGARVLLTGGFGDQLWTGAAWWLRDLLAAGRPIETAAELLRELRGNRGRALGGLRRLLGLPRLRHAAAAAPWLTDEARLELGSVDETTGGRSGDRLRSLLGPRNARSATIEIFHASLFGIELRHPFRDLRLVEFALGLAAHQLYRRRRKKHLLRRALSGLLPETVLARRHPTSLAALYRRGVFEREVATVRDLLAPAGLAGNGIVRRQWLEAARSRSLGSPADELALWHCVTLELWHRRHAGYDRGEMLRTA